MSSLPDTTQPVTAGRTAPRRARGSLPQVDAPRPHRGQLPAHGHVHPVRRRGAAGHRLRGHRAGGVHRGVPQGVPLHRAGGRGRRRAHQDHPQGRRDHRGHDPRRGRDHGAGRPRRRVQPGRARQAGRGARDLQQGDEVGPQHAVADGRRRSSWRSCARCRPSPRLARRAGAERRRGHRLRARQDRHHPPQRAPVPGPHRRRRRRPRALGGRRRGSSPAPDVDGPAVSGPRSPCDTMGPLDRKGLSVQHFSDRLATAIRARRSVVCVGLDPVLERMPRELVEKYRPQAAELGEDAAVAACFQEFCSGVIDAVAEVAACVKPQAAFFEQYGAAGWRALGAVINCAHEYDLPVILDVKRGDIASTGAAYGHAAFGGAAGFAGPAAGIGADAVTASPYLGDDSLQPLVDHCAERPRRLRPHAHEQPRRRAPAGGRGGRAAAVPARRRPGARARRRARRRGRLQRRGRGRRRHRAGAAAPRARGSAATRSCWCRATAPRAAARTPWRASPPATPPGSSSTRRAPSSSPGRTPAATIEGLRPRPPNLCAATSRTPCDRRDTTEEDSPSSAVVRGRRAAAPALPRRRRRRIRTRLCGAWSPWARRVRLRAGRPRADAGGAGQSTRQRPASGAPAAPVGGSKRTPRARPRPRPAGGSRSTRMAARIAAPDRLPRRGHRPRRHRRPVRRDERQTTPTPDHRRSRRPRPATAPRPPRPRSTWCRSGDSLSSIAVRFGTTTSEILALNPDLSGSTLVVGQRLVVPRQ